MKTSCSALVAILCFFCLGCSSSKPVMMEDNVVTAADLQPFGRYKIYNGKPLELISSGVHFGYTFEGTESQVYATVPGGDKHGYLQYELDGIYQKRIRIAAGDTTPVTIKAPAPGKHTVWVYKATEAHSGPVLIEKVVGENVESIQRPTAPVIEFIGNSITSGAAADASEVPCQSAGYHEQHNAYMAYGPRVARTLGANFILSSVSGYGVYRNWNADGPTLPQVYEKIDFQEESPELWDFETYSPRLVSIALGTNDLSKGDGVKPRAPFDSARFIKEYVAFVELVKDIYPAARIALLRPPTVTKDNVAVFDNSLHAIKERIDALYPKDKPVALYFFTLMTGSGCTGHPSVEDHAVMAEEVLPFFKKLLEE